MVFESPPGLTCVLRPDRKSALTGWENLQLHNIRSAGQQLRGLHQRAVLGAGPVYRQEDVAYMQRSTPETVRRRQIVSGKFCVIGKYLRSTLIYEDGFTFPPRWLLLSCQ